MNASDLTMFAQELALDTREYIAGYVAKALGTVADRCAALEKRLDQIAGMPGMPGPPGELGPAGPVGPPGADGRSVEASEIQALIASAVSAATANLSGLVRDEVTKALASVPAPRDGRDGKDADVTAIKAIVEAGVVAATAQIKVPDVRELVRAEVAQAIAAIPAPKDGAVGPPGPRGQDGKDGASVTLSDVAPIIGAEVTKAMAALPLPKDGKDGADGVSLIGAVIDRADHLVLTLSNGTSKDLGVVVGKDVDLAAVIDAIQAEVDKIPRPKDGQDGRDGLSLEDLDIVLDVDKGWLFRFARGADVKEIPVALPWDAGVWKAGRQYPKGAGVTWNGAFWMAQEATYAKPGEASLDSRAWRLAVKAGKDGKPGQNGRDALG